MNRLNNEELLCISGGFSITGSIINAFASTGKFIYELGKSLGSSLRRISTNKLCAIR